MPRKKKSLQPVTLNISKVVAWPLAVLLIGAGIWLGSVLLSPPNTQLDGVNYSFTSLLVRYLLGVVMVAAVLWPAGVLINALLKDSPFAIFDESGIRAIKWPFMRNQIDWENVDQLSGRGIWVVLMDKNKRQHKMIEGIVGAKGLWLPTVLAEGGAARVAEAIRTFQPELLAAKGL